MKGWQKFIIPLMALLLFATFVFCDIRISTSANSLGREAVTLMYDFDDPNDLPEQYRQLRKIVDDATWNKLDFDNEMRITNTYFKFKAAKTNVVFESVKPGVIVYRLENDNVSRDILWTFEYDIKEGKLTNVRESRLIGQTDLVKK